MKEQDLIDFENDVIKEYKKGEIYGSVHLCGGNEKQLIEIFKQIKDDDWVFSNHRAHYHILLKSKDKKWMMREIKKGHSDHINSNKYKIFTSVIVGGIIPIALGTAMAIKRKGGKNKVWCFIGDHASEMGCFDEAVKYAENFDLPVIFIIENNKIGSNMETEKVWGKQIKIISPKVINYEYSMTKSHYGIGEWIKFKGKNKFKGTAGMYGR